MVNDTEIKHGRIELNGYACGTATYSEPTGSEVLLISHPIIGLLAYVDGKRIPKPTETMSMIWAKVAGWLGTAEFVEAL